VPRALLLALLAISIADGARAQGNADPSGPVDPVLAACAARADAVRGMRQRQQVRVVSEAGWVRESRRTLSSARAADGTFKLLLALDAPKRDAGLKVLAVVAPHADPVIHVYTPDTGRARRVVGSGASSSVLGTDFTFEDALLLQDLPRAPGTRRLGGGLRDGRPVLLLETVPAADDSAYGRIESELDSETCVPLTTRFHARNGDLAKTLEIPPEAIRHVDGHPIPARLAMTDHLRGTRTEIVVNGIEIDPVLPARLFTVGELEQRH
jgi:hypothetical protein